MSAKTCSTHEALATPVFAEDAYWGGFYVNNREHIRLGLSSHPTSIGVLAGVGDYCRRMDMDAAEARALQGRVRVDALPEWACVDLAECGRGAHGFGRVIMSTMVQASEFGVMVWRGAGVRPNHRRTCRDSSCDSRGWSSDTFADNYPGMRWGTWWTEVSAECCDDDGQVAEEQRKGAALQSVRALLRDDASRALRCRPVDQLCGLEAGIHAEGPHPAGRAGVPPRQGGAREGASMLEKVRAAQSRSATPARWLAADGLEGE